MRYTIKRIGLGSALRVGLALGWLIALFPSLALAWLALAALLGLAAVSLRMNYLPVVIVITLGLPLLFLFDRRHAPRARVLAVHCVFAAACFWATHGEYRQYVGTLFERPPGYIGQAGFMRMGLVAPLSSPWLSATVRPLRDAAAAVAQSLRRVPES